MEGLRLARLAANLALAGVLVVGGRATALARPEPGGTPDLRSRLVKAFREAPSVHRCYRLEKNGEDKARMELFKAGALLGFAVGNQDMSAYVLGCTDGRVVKGQFEEEQDLHLRLGALGLNDFSRPYEEVASTLTRRFGLPDRPREPWVASPRLSFGPIEGEPTKVRVSASVSVFRGVSPSWLESADWVEERQPEPPGEVLARSKTPTTDVRVHLADGSIAGLRWTHPQGGVEMLVQEVRPLWSAETWRSQIRDACSNGPAVDVNAERAVAAMVYADALEGLLETVPSLADDAVERKSAVRAWVRIWSAARTKRWTEAIEAAKGEVSPAGVSASEPSRRAATVEAIFSAEWAILSRTLRAPTRLTKIPSLEAETHEAVQKAVTEAVASAWAAPKAAR